MKEKKKSWEPFRIYLLNSTANPAQFRGKLVGLAVLFSSLILNDGSHDFFFLFNILILIYLFKYETIETHALAFLTLIILAISWTHRTKNKRNLPLCTRIIFRNHSSCKLWIALRRQNTERNPCICVHSLIECVDLRALWGLFGG